MTFDMPEPIAVVPIFVNAGAALLPALIAGATNFFSQLLRPRELLRTCVRRPIMTSIVVLCAAGLGFGGTWIWGKLSVPGPRAAKAADDRIDWAQVALAVLRREEALANEARTTQPTTRRTDQPVVFRYDYSRCGHDGGPAPAGLKLLWEFPQKDGMILSSPLVHGKRVFGASCTLDVADDYGAVFCLNAETGKPIWSVDRIGKEDLKGVFSSPALSADGNYLIIGQGLHPDKDCHLICLEAATGKPHWRIKTTLHIESSPAIWGDVVVAGAGAIEGPDHKPVSDPGFVLAVRISDGKELWRAAVIDPESSPAIADGVAYIGSGFNGNAVVALRMESDEELKKLGVSRVLWKKDTPYPATGAVTVAGDLVIIGCGEGDYVYASPNPAGLVIALDRKTGEVRWQRKLPDCVLGAVAVRDGKAICPIRNGEVAALDAKNGEVLWRKNVGDRAAILAGPAFAGPYVYAVTKDGYLAVLDAATGDVKEKHYINAQGRPGEMGMSISSPVIVGGRLYVGSETGGLRCFVGQRTAP